MKYLKEHVIQTVSQLKNQHLPPAFNHISKMREFPAIHTLERVLQNVRDSVHTLKSMKLNDFVTKASLYLKTSRNQIAQNFLENMNSSQFPFRNVLICTAGGVFGFLLADWIGFFVGIVVGGVLIQLNSIQRATGINSSNAFFSKFFSL